MSRNIQKTRGLSVRDCPASSPAASNLIQAALTRQGGSDPLPSAFCLALALTMRQMRIPISTSASNAENTMSCLRVLANCASIQRHEWLGRCHLLLHWIRSLQFDPHVSNQKIPQPYINTTVSLIIQTKLLLHNRFRLICCNPSLQPTLYESEHHMSFENQHILLPNTAYNQSDPCYSHNL